MLNSITASAQLNANFVASQTAGCVPLAVSFTDLSTGNPTSWNWNFGSSTSTNQNPVKIYSTPGIYSVTLTITSGASSDTEIKIAYINAYDKPQANFTLNTDTACVGQTVTFTSTTVISAGGSPIATYAWDFGDGNSQTVTTLTTTHAYTTPGTYPVSLIVTDTTGCTGVINIPNAIVVIPAPTVAFTSTNPVACLPPLTVNFTNTSTTVGNATYLWNFGNGTTSTATSPSCTYTATGSYNVTLVINQNGCIDSLVMPNYVMIQNIAASFNPSPPAVCTGQSIQFNNTSVPAATGANWDFGDGNNSTVLSPSHIYTTAGTYTVTLIASANGCIDTTTGTVIVHQTPTANFAQNHWCTGKNKHTVLFF